MARKRKYRKKEASLPELLIGLAALVILGSIYKAFKWYQENTEFFWGIVTFVIILGVVSFLLFRKYKRSKEKAALDGLPEKVREVKILLDKFTLDIPKFSHHSETNYQIDFGRFLKDHMTKDKIEYEVSQNGTRPDIVINDKLAIEIKALKSADTEKGKRYNSMHVDSIFKKIHTYSDQFVEVVIIIFNSDHVKDKKWRDYENMKKAVTKQGVILFEK